MNIKKMKEARVEAVRFLQRLNTLERKYDGIELPNWTCPKESGALRRASMDLTRALAELRRG